MSTKPHPLVDRVNRHLRKESSKSKKGQITAIEERSARPTEGAGPNLSHRLPQFPIASTLLRFQIVYQEAHHLILPPLRGLIFIHFHTLTPSINSPMGASAEFITGTVFAAVMVLIGLGAIWIVRWQTYFLIHHQGKSPDMFL